MNGSYQTDLKCLAKTAMQVAEQTGRVCDKLNRLDEFDEEQRAEMYAILQALKREATDDADALQGLLTPSQEVDCV